ncbi:hypothetical protein ACWG5N_29345 [Streptomyces globisporus]
MKRDYLAWAALAAALVVTASAEYALARAAGFGQWTAAGVPAALDIYAVRAMRAHRDVPAVVGAMILVNAAAHMVEAGLLTVSWYLVVGVSAIAPLVLWRVHRLAEVPAAAPAEPGGNTPAPVVNTPVFTEAYTPDEVNARHTAEPPAIEPAPAVDPLVICGERHVFTLSVPPAVAEEKVNTRLSAEDAHQKIRDAWVNRLGVRETARVSTRSPAYVTKVFTQLTKAAEEHTQAPASLALVATEASA